MINNEVNQQAFFDVIKAIDSANDKELLALARVEKAINKVIANNVINPTAGATSKKPGTGDFTPVSSVAGRRKKREKDKAEGRSRSTSSRSTSTQPTSSQQNTRTRRTKNTNNTEQAAIPDPVTPTVKIPAEITATATSQQTPADIAATSTSQQTPAELAATSEQESHNEEAEKQQKETNELLAGLYEDSQGRLRQASGAFASRQQNEALKASQGPSEDEESQSLLKSLSTWAVGQGKSVSGNDAADSAGVAVGSSLWLATKEIGQMTTSALDLATNNKLTSMAGIKERASQAKNALKNPKDALLSLFGRGAGPQTDGPQTISSVDRTVSAVQSNPNGLGDVVSASGNDSASSNLSTTNQDNSAVTSESQGRAANERDRDTASDRLAESANEQTDILSDQNISQIALLEQIEAAIGSAGGGGGSLFGGDGPDRRNRRGRRGRSRGRGRLGRLGGRLGGRMGGVLATGGTMAAGAASGASKVAGGAKFLAKGAAKMVPFLAPLMAGYDAVSGFNDDERQKEVFDLKKGEEASTGQKSAMALGNMLDMGGLVSGGAGLLGSLMGGMGFDGAQEALTFDTDSMTKGIYSLFGGDTPDDTKEPAKTSQVAQANQDADNKAQGETPIVTSTSPTKNQSKGIDPTGPTNNRSTASSDYTAPAIKAPQSGAATPPINVTAQSDPALTKVMAELLKETKENNRKANDKGSSGNKTYNKYTSNVTAQNKSGDAGIPIGPSNPQLQLIALDAN